MSVVWEGPPVVKIVVSDEPDKEELDWLELLKASASVAPEREMRVDDGFETVVDVVRPEDIEVMVDSFSRVLDVVKVRMAEEYNTVSDNVSIDVVFVVEDESGYVKNGVVSEDVSRMFVPSDEVLKLAATVEIVECVIDEDDSIVEVNTCDTCIEECADVSVEVMKLSGSV